MATKRPKVYVKTFGCQMNVRDSEVIAGLMKARGWTLAKRPEEANVIVLNTCSVREHAEDRAWSIVGQIAKKALRRSKHRPLIGLVGCMAQNYKADVFTRAPAVDFAVGPSDIAKIPVIIQGLFTDDGRPLDFARGKRTTDDRLFDRKIWETDGNKRPEDVYQTGFYEDKEHAYVVISEGCSNHCSYCIVPYVRGELRNRPARGILKEVRQAVERGITKITLLGQNVNAWKEKDADFTDLLRKVSVIDGIEELSFVTSHPRDTSIALFRAMAECQKIKKCLHLPVQSGSDKMLGLMGRGYTRKYYLDLAENYRKIVQGGKLTTDIIVGFPTESQKDFQDTYDLLNTASFEAAYIFKYSSRPHTRAAGMPDDVPREEKEKRHSLILGLQRVISKPRIHNEQPK